MNIDKKIIWLLFGLFIQKISALPIEEGWRIQKGDNPAWSQPNFDDSAWKAIIVG